MTEYRVGLDGITINRTVDLLLDFPEEDERLHRNRALRGYYHALHQLVSAAVFAGRLVFDRKIVPGSIRQDKATDFMRSLDFAGSASEPFIVFDQPPDPIRLLDEPSATERIKQALRAVERVVLGLDDRLWHDYIVRECGNYLGSDSTLFRSDVPPGEYQFANGTRDFFVNPDTEQRIRPLLDEISSTAVEKLVQWCRPIAPTVAQEALQELCRRSVFAHILIGENVASHLDHQVESRLRSDDEIGAPRREVDGFSDVWACDTRQTLQQYMPVREGTAAEEGFADSRAISAVVPYALEIVLRHTSMLDPVRSLIDGIAQVREIPEFNEVREMLYSYRKTRSHEAASDLRRVTDEINRMTNLSGPDRLRITVSTDLPITPKTSFDVLRPVGRWTGTKLPRQMRARWVGRYIAAGARKDETEKAVLEHLVRIFPNTFR